MTLYEFNALNESEKANITWSGILIGDRENLDYRILLYQVNAFYVEVYYNKELNEVTKFSSFSSTKPLVPYLDKINLVCLLQHNYYTPESTQKKKKKKSNLVFLINYLA